MIKTVIIVSMCLNGMSVSVFKCTSPLSPADSGIKPAAGAGLVHGEAGVGTEDAEGDTQTESVPLPSMTAHIQR